MRKQLDFSYVCLLLQLDYNILRIHTKPSKNTGNVKLLLLLELHQAAVLSVIQFILMVEYCINDIP